LIPSPRFKDYPVCENLYEMDTIGRHIILVYFYIEICIIGLIDFAICTYICPINILFWPAINLADLSKT